MAGTANVYVVLGNSWANGDGMISNYTGTPQVYQMSLTSYNSYVLRETFIRPWASGETSIVAGYQRYNGGHVYEAQGSGTCGATPPTHTTGTASDGTITWLYLRSALAARWVTGQSVTTGDLRNHLGNIYEAQNSATTGITAPVHTSGTTSDGAVNWLFVRSALVPAWQASTRYYPGDVVYNGGTRRYYQCVTEGISAASGGPTTTATSITDNTAAWRCLATYSGTAALNDFWEYAPRIWHTANTKWQKLNVGNNTNQNPTDETTYHGIGTHIPIAAQLMTRYDPRHTYIVKHAKGRTNLSHVSNSIDWSVQSYDGAPSSSMLKGALDKIVTCAYDLLGRDSSGTNYTAWASGATSITVGMLRTANGNVYEAKTAGTAGSTAPSGTGQAISDGTLQWRFVHTIYDNVKIIGLFSPSESDGQQRDYAYSYLFEKLSYLARINDRLNISVGGGVFYTHLELAGARNQTGTYTQQPIPLWDRITDDAKNALQIYSNLQTGSTVTPTDSTYYTLYGNYGAFIKTKDMVENVAYLDNSIDAGHPTCAGTEEQIRRVFLAHDAATSQSQPTWGVTQNTSFTVPSYSSTSINETYDTTDTVSITLSNAVNFGSDSLSNVVWDSPTDSNYNGTGSTLSKTPKKYNGQYIRSYYVNNKGYCAYKIYFTYILGPRDKVTQYATPKQWIRGLIGHSTGVNDGINYIPNYVPAASGIPSDIYAVQAGALTVQKHHDGLCLTNANFIAFNKGATSESTPAAQATYRQNAALATASDASVTRIVKFTPKWRMNEIQNVYGGYYVNASAGINGSGITLAASGSSSQAKSNVVPLSVIYCNNSTLTAVSGLTTSDSGTSDGFDVDQTICAALVTNGTTETLYYLNSSGVMQTVQTTGVPSKGTQASYPDVLGAIPTSSSNTILTGRYGFEGIIHEVIGYESALTGTQVNEILQQIAATDIPLNGTSTTTLDNTTNTTAGSVSTPVLGSSTTNLDNISVYREKVWVELKDSYGNSVVNPLLVPNQIGKVGIGGSQSLTLGNVSVTQEGAATAPPSATGTSTVTLQSISTTKEKVWVEIKDSYGNRLVSSLLVPSQVGTVELLTTGSSVVNLANVSVAREKVWVEIKDNSGNRTVSSVIVPNQFGSVQTVNSGTSTNTLSGISRSATGTLFAGMSLVTLAAPLLLTSGSILDPVYWTGTPPAVGDQIYYPSTNGFLIEPNGAMSASVNTGSWTIYYNDGTGWYPNTITFEAGRYGTQTLSLLPVSGSQLGGVTISGVQNLTLNSVVQTSAVSGTLYGSSIISLASVLTTQNGIVPIVGSYSVNLIGLEGWVGQGYAGIVPDVGGSTITLDNITYTQSGSLIVSGGSVTSLQPVTSDHSGIVIISGVGSRALQNVITLYQGILGPNPENAGQTVTLLPVSTVTAGFVSNLGFSISNLSGVTTSQQGNAYNNINYSVQNVTLNNVGVYAGGFVNVSLQYIEVEGIIAEIPDYVLSNSSVIVQAFGNIVEEPDEIRERIYLDGGTVSSPLTKLKNFTIIGGR